MVGDPYAAQAQRTSHTSGKVLSLIKDREDVYDSIVDHWVMSSEDHLLKQALGLRFLYAVLSCWQYQVRGAVRGDTDSTGRYMQYGVVRFWVVVGCGGWPGGGRLC